jgi:hypothetical protein
VSDCDHRWLRLPVVDFNVSYQCRECGQVTTVVAGEDGGWMGFAGRTMEDLDRAFGERCGGKVEGLAVPWPGR